MFSKFKMALQLIEPWNKLLHTENYLPKSHFQGKINRKYVFIYTNRFSSSQLYTTCQIITEGWKCITIKQIQQQKYEVAAEELFSVPLPSSGVAQSTSRRSSQRCRKKETDASSNSHPILSLIFGFKFPIELFFSCVRQFLADYGIGSFDVISEFSA